MITNVSVSNIAAHLEECSSGARLCSVYNTKEEQFAYFVPFIKIGLERGERCIYILDENNKSEITMALSLSNLDVSSALESGSLLFLTKTDPCLKFLQSDSLSMLRYLDDTYTNAISTGFKGLRIAVEMGWVVNCESIPNSLIPFASALNDVMVKDFMTHKQATLLCQCDMSIIPADMIKAIIYAHPSIIFADMLCKNSFYSPIDSLKNSSSAHESLDDLLISVSVSEYLRRNASN